MHTKHYVNGTPSESISVLDRGLRYGDGCFETMAVVDGQIRLWDRHFTRLHTSCDRLRIALQVDKTFIENELQKVIGNATDATLRLTITRGEQPQQTATRIASLLPLKTYPLTYAQEGVDVLLCETPLGRNSALAGIKHLNRLPYVLAQVETADDYAEGLLFDDQNNLIEGTISNVFIVVDGRLITPDLSEAGVSGVMRAEIFDRAAVLGLPIAEQHINRHQLLSADECFLTNALIGIWPVKQINGKQFAVGEITRMLQQDLKSPAQYLDIKH